MASDRYQYKPLSGAEQEIRLLHAFDYTPASDQLHFEVSTTSLSADQPVEYYAVSYAWNDPTLSASIVLDRTTCTVPQSAEAALRGLLQAMTVAEMDVTTPIWIDAICINQDDLVEKSQQVASMDQVFSKASCVLVWLGKDDGTTQSCIRTLKALADQCLACAGSEDQLLADMSLSILEQRGLPYRLDNFPVDCDMLSMESLLMCRYFVRLWVFQELVLARQTVFFRGLGRIDWHDLSLAALWCYHTLERWFTSSRDPYSFFRRLRTIYDVQQLQREGRKVNLAMFNSYIPTILLLETTEPRDKIYGFLSLLDYTTALTSARDMDIWAVNYGKPLVNIYAETLALTMEARTTPLYALYLCQIMCAPSVMDSDWPSWVPQMHIVAKGVGHYAPRQDVPFVATKPAGQVPVNVNLWPDMILQVAATEIDTITYIWPPPLAMEQAERVWNTPDTAIQATIYQHFAYMWREAFAKKIKSPWTRRLMLCVSRTISNRPSYSDDEELGCFKLLMQRAREHVTDSSDLDLDLDKLLADIDPSDNIENYIRTMSEDGAIYPMFVTDQGRFGLGGHEIIADDKIFFLHEAPGLFVMRKFKDVWKLRGTCQIPTMSEEEIMRVIEENGPPRIYDIN